MEKKLIELIKAKADEIGPSTRSAVIGIVDAEGNVQETMVGLKSDLSAITKEMMFGILSQEEDDQ